MPRTGAVLPGTPIRDITRRAAILGIAGGAGTMIAAASDVAPSGSLPVAIATFVVADAARRQSHEAIFDAYGVSWAW